MDGSAHSAFVPGQALQCLRSYEGASFSTNGQAVLLLPIRITVHQILPE